MANAPTWTAVVAVAQNGVIGRGNDLPWRLSSDLKRFKQLTMGHCLLMGRKTFESIGKPLPGRQTIVLTRNGMPNIPHIAQASSLEQVENLVEPDRNIMVVGGAQIYRAALARCDQLWLTRVLEKVAGDTFFPEVNWKVWQLESSETIEPGPKDEWPTEFQRWKRRSTSEAIE